VRAACDAEPGEQQKAEPADLVDQRRAPDRAAPAAVQKAGGMVQLVQLRCAFECVGFEAAFRSALARAKARCRCQSLGQRGVQQARRVAPGQQVGDDYQYDGEGNG
jgi:hypothetical protein